MILEIRQAIDTLSLCPVPHPHLLCGTEKRKVAKTRWPQDRAGEERSKEAREWDSDPIAQPQGSKG